MSQVAGLANFCAWASQISFKKNFTSFVFLKLLDRITIITKNNNDKKFLNLAEKMALANYGLLYIVQ